MMFRMVRLGVAPSLLHGSSAKTGNVFMMGAGWYNADSSLAHPEISKLKGIHDSS